MDNIEIINDTCKLANIERLTPDNVDVNDINVWKSLRESTLGVFQFESETAYDYVQTLFSDETLQSIRNNVGEVDYINLLSMANGAIRPAGNSYRNELSKGINRDNGHIALNNFLKSNLGYLIFQEDIMRFLTDFCNHTGAESDNVRRGLAKKEGTEKFLPKIKEGFINNMVNNYNDTPEHAEELLSSFLDVIRDASDYGFSSNHSSPYSYIGYIGAYLRYYYPLEFITTILNVREDKMDKSAKIISYAKDKGIEVKPIEFGKSISKYTFSKDDNAIYKGLSSIKYMSEDSANELFELAKNNNYNNFVDLLIDITEKTKVKTNQINILIKLGFFKEFGNTRQLSFIYEKFAKRYKKTHKDATKVARIEEVRNYSNELSVEEFSINERLIFEKEVLGYCQLVDYSIPRSNAVIVDIDTKYSPTLTLYIPNNGKDVQLKINKNLFYGDNRIQLLKIGDMIDVLRIDKKPKMTMVNGKWEKTEIMQNWLVGWELISKLES